MVLGAYGIIIPIQTTKIGQGQPIAKFLADHPSIPIQPDHCYSVNSLLVPCVALIPWTLMLDGSKNLDGTEAVIVI